MTGHFEIDATNYGQILDRKVRKGRISFIV